MADPKLRLIIEAKDRASGVIREVKRQTVALGASSVSSLQRAGGGWKALGGGITSVSGILGALLPKVGLPLVAITAGATTALNGIRALGETVGNSIRAAVRTVENVTQRVLSRVISMARTAALAVTAAASAAIGIATKLAVDFEEGMRNVNSIMQLTESGFAHLEKQVKAIAKDPMITDMPTTLAEGLYDIVSSGLEGQVALDTLKVASQGAAAGLSTTATAAQVLASVMNAYNTKTGADAAAIMDVLFRTVDRGVVTFDELAQSFAFASTSAAAAGVPLTDVAAGMMTMTKQGHDAAIASVSLARIITSFLNPTKELTAELKAQGYASGLQVLRTQGLSGAVEFLSQTYADNVDQMVAVLGEQRAVRAAMAMTGKGAQMYAEDLAAAGNATGAMSKALGQQAQSAAFQFKDFKKQLGLIMIDAGRAFLPLAKSLFPLLIVVVRAAAVHLQTFGKNLAVAWEAFTKSKLAQELIAAFQRLGTTIGGMLDKATGISSLSGIITGAARFIIRGVTWLNDFLAGGGLAGIIAWARGALHAFSEAARWIISTVSDVWAWLTNKQTQSAIARGLYFVAFWAAYLYGVFQRVMPQVKQFFEDAWGAIQRGLAWAYTNLPEILTSFTGFFGSVMRGLGMLGWAAEATFRGVIQGLRLFGIIAGSVAFAVVGAIELIIRGLQGWAKGAARFDPTGFFKGVAEEIGAVADTVGKTRGAIGGWVGGLAKNYGTDVIAGPAAMGKMNARWGTVYNAGAQVEGWGARAASSLRGMQTQVAGAQQQITVNISGNVYGVEDLKAAIADGISQANRGARYARTPA